MRIGVISTYPEMTQCARELAADYTGELLVDEGYLEQGVAVATRMEQDGIDAIVTGPVTAVLAKRRVSLPVVMVPVTAYDVMQALYRARELGRRVAFIGHRQAATHLNFQAMGEMLEMSVVPHLYDNSTDLLSQLRSVAAAGYGVVVGTGICIVEAARELQLQGVLVQAQADTLGQAIQTAEASVLTRQRDLERERRLIAVLDSLSAGIVSVDPAGTVKVFNPAAQRLLGIRARDVLGQPVRRCLAHDSFAQAYGDGNPAGGVMVPQGQLHLLVNRHRLSEGESGQGLLITLEDVTQIQRLDQEVREKLRAKGHVARFSFADIVGESPAVRQAVTQARLYARSEANILITGETGTGKELFAQAVHNASRRMRGPFVAVNCAALPENLLESELFGYEEGSFTGARKGGKPGLFEQAHRGTIFLDEIGEITPPVQARLLRVLQEREVMRLGGERVLPIDVRIIAATNRDLPAAVAAGGFRPDLYHRLNVLHLRVPPLRQRSDDIPALLAALFAQHGGSESQCAAFFPPPVLRRLQSHHWPGNVRELENFVQKAVALAAAGDPPAELIDYLLADLTGVQETGQSQHDLPRPAADALAVTLPLTTMDQMEREIIVQAMRLLGPNRSALADFLGISRSTLWRRLRESGIPLDAFGPGLYKPDTDISN